MGTKMRRADVKAKAIEAVKSIGLNHLWQDKPCKLFVVIKGQIKVIDIAAVRSRASFERVLGKIEGWAEALA